MGSEQLLALRSEIKEAEGRIEYARRERETLAETAEVRRNELAQLREQLTAQEREGATTEDELRSVETALESERESVAEAEAEASAAKAASEALEAERERSNASLVDLLTQVARSEDRAASIEDRSAELDAKLRSRRRGARGRAERCRPPRWR